ncbi:ABC transporter ATP-binding protein [Tropicimonas sp.]|uniref:ABC transporter ATP-binding protein n=1 Tax=Tropicimonas sp. TaxID=2067044 RepID=UPI003A856911
MNASARLALRVAGLTVKADNGRPILRAGRLDIAPGEAVVVRGPSGAGKSTLLHVLAGLLPVASGEVRWGETRLDGLGDAARTAFRRRHIGFIFQEHHLFEELSAIQNATLAAAYSPRTERASLLASGRAQLERLGLSKSVERNIATFSGGERQRVAVARALAGNPAIILADEPTASLDRRAADRLIDDLTALARDDGRTLIAVTHDVHFHHRADRILDVIDGVLQPEGGRDDG